MRLPFTLASVVSVTDAHHWRLVSTGVEFAGELHDFLTCDLTRAYPQLVHLCKM